MKKFLCLIFCLCAISDGFSQWRKVEKLPKDHRFGIKLAYHGGLNAYAGGIVGAEWLVQRKAVTIKNWTRTKEKSLTLNFSYFNEPNLNQNLGLHAEWLKRTRYGNGGFFTELAAGIGVGTGINNVSPPTYVKNADGSESIKERDTDFILATITAGLGYDFSIKKHKPIKIFARMGVYPIRYHFFVYNLYPKGEIGLVVGLPLR